MDTAERRNIKFITSILGNTFIKSFKYYLCRHAKRQNRKLNNFMTDKKNNKSLGTKKNIFSGII